MKIIIIVLGLLNIRTCPVTNFTEPGCGGGNPSGVRQVIASNLQLADSVSSVLESLIDGGNTQATLSMIQTEKQRGKVKDTLLAYSPYLSDTVMITLINKNKPYSDGIIKEVILANFPVTDEVMNALLNRNPALAPGIIKEILEAQTGISPRSVLENQRNFFLAEAALAKNELIRTFLHHDTLGMAIDSIIPILEADTLLDAKQLLVNAYLETGDTANAQILIDSLKLIPELTNFATLQQLFIDFGDTLFSAILNDSAVKQQVEQIAADTTKAGSIQARIIMELLFGIRIPEVIVLPSQNQLKTGGGQNGKVEQPVEFISEPIEPESFNTLFEGYTLYSYPNPYKESTIIAAYIPPHYEKSQLIIFNLVGKTQRQYELKPGHNFIEILSDELPYGLSFYSLITGNIRIETQKLVRIK